MYAQMQDSNEEPLLHYGTVISTFESFYLVRTLKGDVKAELSASCLLQPAVNDKVLLCIAQDSYILSVLEHASSALRIATSKPLELYSDDSIGIVAKKQALIMSETLDVFAKKARFSLSDLTLISKLLSAKLSRINASGGVLNSTFERLFSKSKRSKKIVEGLDETTCDASKKSVAYTDITTSTVSITKAKEQVKVDAKIINLA